MPQPQLVPAMHAVVVRAEVLIMTILNGATEFTETELDALEALDDALAEVVIEAE